MPSPVAEAVRIPAPGEVELDGLLVAGDDADGAGIVLVHDACGVDAELRAAAERFGAEGYFVVAPDLFSRAGSPDPRARGGSDEIPRLSDRTALRDLDAAADFLARQEGVSARSIAIVGASLGGTLAFLAGCTSTRFDSVVDLYGPTVYPELDAARPMQPIEMLLNLDRTLLAFFGGADELNPASHVELLREQLTDANKDFELVRYPEAGHGFWLPGNRGFHEDSARDAWERTLAFLDENLR